MAWTPLIMFIYHKPSARDKRAYKEAEQEALTSGTASGFTDCKPPTGPEKNRKGSFHIDEKASIELNKPIS